VSPGSSGGLHTACTPKSLVERVTLMTCVPLYPASVLTARNCAEAGYKGCCDKNIDKNTCWVQGGKCFCDAQCYMEGRCCPDIKAVGCSTG